MHGDGAQRRISGLRLLKCTAFENGLLIDFLQQRIGENCVACIEGRVFGPLGIWQRFRVARLVTYAARDDVRPYGTFS